MGQALLDIYVQLRTPWAGQAPESGHSGLSELSEGPYDQVPAAVSVFPCPWALRDESIPMSNFSQAKESVWERQV